MEKHRPSVKTLSNDEMNTVLAGRIVLRFASPCSEQPNITSVFLHKNNRLDSGIFFIRIAAITIKLDRRYY